MHREFFIKDVMGTVSPETSPLRDYVKDHLGLEYPLGDPSYIVLNRANKDALVRRLSVTEGVDPSAAAAAFRDLAGTWFPELNTILSTDHTDISPDPEMAFMKALEEVGGWSLAFIAQHNPHLLSGFTSKLTAGTRNQEIVAAKFVVLGVHCWIMSESILDHQERRPDVIDRIGVLDPRLRYGLHADRRARMQQLGAYNSSDEVAEYQKYINSLRRSLEESEQRRGSLGVDDLASLLDSPDLVFHGDLFVGLVVERLIDELGIGQILRGVITQPPTTLQELERPRDYARDLQRKLTQP